MAKTVRKPNRGAAAAPEQLLTIDQLVKDVATQMKEDNGPLSATDKEALRMSVHILSHQDGLDTNLTGDALDNAIREAINTHG